MEKLDAFDQELLIRSLHLATCESTDDIINYMVTYGIYKADDPSLNHNPYAAAYGSLSADVIALVGLINRLANKS